MAEPRLVVLKTPAFGTAGGTLPYRIDHLAGFQLVWDDRRARLQGRRARLVGRLEAITTPFLQTWHLRRAIGDADAVLAFFESEGHGLALARSFGLRRRPVLVIVSCWLGEVLPRLGRMRRWLYRRMYRHVDLVTVFSANQCALVASTLGLDAQQVQVVPFGVDVDELSALAVHDGGYLLAVGRDSARDWDTLYTGVAGSGARVIALARPSRLPDRTGPAELESLGYVPRERYLELLAGCSGVLVVTRDVCYPSGQTVLLEALALGKRCIVTDTAAMRSFGGDLPCTWVPIADPDALRAAIRDLPDAPVPTVERSRLDAAGMWAAVATLLRERLDRRG